MSLPDTPPTPSYVAANNNSILDLTVTSSRALSEELSWDLVSNWRRAILDKMGLNCLLTEAFVQSYLKKLSYTPSFFISNFFI